MIGRVLSHYKVVERLGAGGMGEVYKAEDTRLNRHVAIKVLPPHLSDNAERRERFEREARVISSLNHPHICTLHDFDTQDGVDFLVMEYIEGETLADRLKKGPLPLDLALRYAVEIADALDKAHLQGVVHRDLKPGNIMLNRSGVKLLDFGLAKLTGSLPPEGGLGWGGSNDSEQPTQQKPLTNAGAILGTFQYMAPEQLEGKEADTRTDIFAFGSVLYEMVTGKKAFEGKSQASLIGAILKDDPPPPSELQPMSPPLLDRVVKKCLAKDPQDRWQTAHDLTDGLKWIAEGGSQAGVWEPVAAAPPRLWKRVLAIGLIILMTAVLTGIAVWSLLPQAEQAIKRFPIIIPATERVGEGVALSPNGRELVYVGIRDGVRQLFRRSMNQLDASPITGTEDATYPFFSPDGEWVGFFSGGELKKISLTGGPPVTLCDVRRQSAGAVWGPDDWITFSSSSIGRFSSGTGLIRVPAAGGEPRQITIPDSEQGEINHGWMDVLPGGNDVLFTVWYGSVETAQIAVQSLETGERRELLDGTHPRYVSTGHIVFARESSLWAVPFDAGRLELTGSPTPLQEDIQVTENGLALYSLADDGSLVFAGGVFLDVRRGQLVWADREGRTVPIVEGSFDYWYPRLSPDGRRLAVLPEGLFADIYLYDLERDNVRSRLTFEGGNAAPIWTPDGEHIAYSAGTRVDWLQADGGGQAEPLMTSEHAVYPHSWSPDGNILAFYELKNDQRDIWMLPLEGADRAPMSFVETPFNERSPSFSPDGRFVAYVSDESGRDEVYLQPYPGPGGKTPVSADGGRDPVWCPAGGELYYRYGDKMMAVPVETAPELEVGIPRVLFEGRFLEGTARGAGGQFYDVSSDCRRFVLIRESEDVAPAQTTQLTVVLNWFEELKRLVPGN